MAVSTNKWVRITAAALTRLTNGSPSGRACSNSCASATASASFCDSDNPLILAFTSTSGFSTRVATNATLSSGILDPMQQNANTLTHDCRVRNDNLALILPLCMQPRSQACRRAHSDSPQGVLWSPDKLYFKLSDRKAPGHCPCITGATTFQGCQSQCQ
jgi:hypothetical protein